MVERGTTIELVAEVVTGTAERITLRPARGLRRAERGAHGSRSTSTAWCCGSRRSATDGRGPRSSGAVRSAPTRVRWWIPPVPLLPLSEKDLAALSIGRRLGISHYALSFASSAEAVRQTRELIPAHAHIIAKIESIVGVAAHGRDHRGERRRADRPRRPLPRGAARADPLLPEGDRAAGQPLAHTALRRHQPARVDGHLQPADHRRDERHRQHAARRRPRPRPGGRDGHRRGSGRCGRHGQAGHRGLRAGGLRSAHRRHSPRGPRGRQSRVLLED